MSGRWAILGATMLAGIAGNVAAQPVTGPYVSLGAGGNLVQDESVRLNQDFPGGKVRFGGGAAGVAAAGWGFGNGFRLEIEGDERYNGVQHFLTAALPTVAGGEQQNYGGMVNAFFDMDIGQGWIYPYFGAGIGYSITRWDHVQFAGPGLDENASGSSGNFAYQGIFGLSFPVAFVPGLSLTAEYRFFSALGPETFNADSIGTVGAFGPKPEGVARGTLSTTTDHNHSALLGLRYAFYQPPPPATPAPPAPPAAPAPAAARTYLVFFDWDRADLTTRGRQIVAEAAQASTHVQTTKIEVNGYTDLSGTAAYNERLSIRRAQTVEAELVRDGVPDGEITIHGFGETNPLVPTAKGVREPQNRRVEIILH